MSNRPLCFVLMPFGVKSDPAGGAPIDFNCIYQAALEPAIRTAGLDPIRADEEKTGGIIHKPMFERLLFCEFALADLTTANANVFYELGVRHTARPSTTLAIFARHQPIPFDVNYLRALPYALGHKNTFTEAEAEALRTKLTRRLQELREQARQGSVDSPVFQLLKEWKPTEVAHTKTDTFRERAQYSESIKQRLATVRNKAKDETTRAGAERNLAQIRRELGNLDGDDTAVVIDLMLTYRAIENWDGVIELTTQMPASLRRQILVREQLAFAINRRAGSLDKQGEKEAERERALDILREVEDQQGPNSETSGLIGRIYKDRWQEAKAQDPIAARGHLNQAIEAYLRGFRADARDAYPGINVLTLLDIRGDTKSLREKDNLLPVVRFAVEQRLAGKSPDYWDQATLLELAVLDNLEDQAIDHLSNTLAKVREPWEPKSTARNLEIIQQARSERGVDTRWVKQIIERLKR